MKNLRLFGKDIPVPETDDEIIDLDGKNLPVQETAQKIIDVDEDLHKSSASPPSTIIQLETNPTPISSNKKRPIQESDLQKFSSSTILATDLLVSSFFTSPSTTQVLDPIPIRIARICPKRQKQIVEDVKNEADVERICQDKTPVLSSRKLSVSRKVDQEKGYSNRKPRITVQPHSQLLSQRILNEVRENGGTDPVYLFQKILSASDVNRAQGRLFTPRAYKEKLIEPLTAEEILKVDEDKEGLRVSIIYPNITYHELLLKNSKKLKVIILKSGWSDLVDANQLKEGDSVEFWGYRQYSKFCLAFSIKKAPENIPGGDEVVNKNNADGPDSNGESSSGSNDVGQGNDGAKAA